MTDVVVTVPMNFTYEPAPGLKGLAAWAAEGDKPGDPWSGQEWDFTTWGHRPTIEPGERVYVVCQGRLRGYAPLIRLETGPYKGRNGAGSLIFVRGGGAVAVTIPQAITGFRGWRYRWWDRAAEQPFPDWLADAAVDPEPVVLCESDRHLPPPPRALWCAVYRSPAGDVILHQHLCSAHAKAEGRRHADVEPMTKCAIVRGAA